MARFALIVALCLTLAAGRTLVAKVNPVTQVVKLLENLALKIDHEIETEEDLYEGFECFANKLIKTKTASNVVATARMKDLKTQISDLNSGRTELTTERSELEATIGQLHADIEKNDNIRAKELAEYTAASRDADAGIVGLTSAITILDTATAANKPGGVNAPASLLNLRSRVSQATLAGASEGFEQRSGEALGLELAVDAAKEYLKPGDMLFLQRLLTGDVPASGKKEFGGNLAAKSEFANKYGARSTGIQKTLAKLKLDFVANKAELDRKEQLAVTTHASLMGSKKNELTSAQESLNGGSKEKGAAAVKREDMQNEVDALQAQFDEDTRSIKQTTTELDTKSKEWAVRKGLRLGEIQAINKAIGILHSDAARDNFRKGKRGHYDAASMLEETPVSLLQIKSDSHSTMIASSKLASVAIMKAFQASGDMRLKALAARIDLHSGDAFAIGATPGDQNAAFTAIDTAMGDMLLILTADNNTDIAKKATCETDRSANTASATLYSRILDQELDNCNGWRAEIAGWNKDIANLRKDIADAEAARAAANKLRASENVEWQASDASDASSIATLGSAAKAISDYNTANFALMQEQQAPATWSGGGKNSGYAGATTESNGIVRLITLIQNDTMADRHAAKVSEAAAVTANAAFNTLTDETVATYNTNIQTKNNSIAANNEEIIKSDKVTVVKKAELKLMLKTMKDLMPGCDFLLVNFATRNANRQLEYDGLHQAQVTIKANLAAQTAAAEAAALAAR